MTTRGLEQWLRRLTLRSVLNDADRAAVLALPGRPVTVPANRDFVGLGDLVTESCLIVAGLAGRFGQVRNGQRQITALHIPGDMADLHSAVLPEAASALQALTEVQIYRVPHAALNNLGARRPAVQKAFWRDCTVDAAVLSQWAVVNTRLPAVARLAHLLCEITCRFAVATDAPAIEFELALTQQHLGDITGLTPVHVNRMLRELREAGLVEISGRRVTILDWKGLRRAGQFDDTYLQLHLAPAV